MLPHPKLKKKKKITHRKRELKKKRSDFLGGFVV